jgi:hypothetical protein
VVEVCLRVLAGFGAEAVCVDADRDPVRVDLLQLPDLVGDVGVDDGLFGLGEQFDQRSQAPAMSSSIG